METTRYDDVLAPTGFEVESASLHMPTGSTDQSHVSEPGWKSRAMTGLDRARSTVSGKIDSMRRHASSTMSAIQPKVTDSMKMMSGRISAARRNPAVVAGVAGGVGVAAGILGHMLRRRMRPAAGFMIVETCY